MTMVARERTADCVVAGAGPAGPDGVGVALEGGALGRLERTAERWVPGTERTWVPLRPERVAEVGYDHLEGVRCRHPGRPVRGRPDRDPASCTTEPLR